MPVGSAVIHSHFNELLTPRDPITDTIGYWLTVLLVIVLVLLSGTFSGLTLALLSQDDTHLTVLEQSDNPTARARAFSVHQLLHGRRHWILITLLLANVALNETLPLLLQDVFGSGWQAVVASSVLIIIFAELLPQAICVRFGLAISAAMAWFVRGLMYIFAPIAYPSAKLLDWWLGEHEGIVYRKAELKTLVKMHQIGCLGSLHVDEVTMIHSVLELAETPIHKVMTPIEDVYTLRTDDTLDQAVMNDILRSGYSRIPVVGVDGKEFVGMLLVKRLITYDADDCLPVHKFTLSQLPEADPDLSCLDILNYFQEGKSHMALITVGGEDAAEKRYLGVITLEDVIEKLIGEEIIDETDIYVDVHNKIRVSRAASVTLPRPKATNICALAIRQRTFPEASKKKAPLRTATDTAAVNETTPLIERV